MTGTRPVAVGLFGLLLGAASPASGQRPLHVERLELERGPQVLLHAEAGPLVALRLSTPVPVETPEGVVELLQELARPGAQEEAGRLGATLQLRHEGGRAILSLAGPVSAFDALARLLRRAVAEPELGVVPLRAARARAEDRVLGGVERPDPRARLLLWHRLAGRAPAAPGSAAGLALELEALRGLHERLYDLDSATLVVVGSVPPEILRSAFAGWGSGRRPGHSTTPDAGDPATARAAAAPAHQAWVALGYPLRTDPAILAVAAELVDRRIRTSALRHGAAEAWHGAFGSALVVLGAADPDDPTIRSAAALGSLPRREDGDDRAGASTEASTVAVYLRRMIAEAAALGGPEDVRRAAHSVAARLLVEARSVPGKAEVLGRVADATGAADGADALLARLPQVTWASVHTVLTAALEAPPLLVEVGQ